LAEVDIVVDGTTEKVRGVDLVGVDRVGLKEHGSLVVGRDDDGGVVGLVAVDTDVEGLRDTVFSDLDRSKAIGGVLGLKSHRNGGEESRDKIYH
jgi:hypothetical protein